MRWGFSSENESSFWVTKIENVCPTLNYRLSSMFIGLHISAVFKVLCDFIFLSLSDPQVSLCSQLCLSVQRRQHCKWVIVRWQAERQPPGQSGGSFRPLWPLPSYAGTDTLCQYRYRAWPLGAAGSLSIHLCLRWRGSPPGRPCPRWDCLCAAMERGWMWCLGNTGSLSASTLKVSTPATDECHIS